MRVLLRAQLDQVGHCALLGNLHAIYSALKAGIQQYNPHADSARLRCVCCQAKLSPILSGLFFVQ